MSWGEDETKQASNSLSFAVDQCLYHLLGICIHFSCRTLNTLIIILYGLHCRVILLSSMCVALSPTCHYLMSCSSKMFSNNKRQLIKCQHYHYMIVVYVIKGSIRNNCKSIHPCMSWDNSRLLANHAPVTQWFCDRCLSTCTYACVRLIFHISPVLAPSQHIPSISFDIENCVLYSHSLLNPSTVPSTPRLGSAPYICTGWGKECYDLLTLINYCPFTYAS